MNEQTMAIINSMIPFILIIAVFYFMLIRPQKKREKETQNMRNSIDVGHEIVTGGGIIGTVVSGNRNRLRPLQAAHHPLGGCRGPHRIGRGFQQEISLAYRVLALHTFCIE